MNNSEFKVGIIGAGNMGSAIIKGIIKDKQIPYENIYVGDIDQNKLMEIKNIQKNINISKDNKVVVQNSNLLILCIKPQIFENVAKEISEHIDKNKLLVSIAPGISIKKMMELFPAGTKIIRAMPNTPALVGCGMTAFSANDRVNSNELDTIFSIFSGLGEVEIIDENLMDCVTAISGSSPAYVYMFIEALADGAVLKGMSREKAYKICSQAVMGAAKMVLETENHPGVLKDMVCSPGGTTIEAVYTLEKCGFRAAIIEAVKTCEEKSKQMGR
ncbi:MAG: pyrroline-5-carboxylate reductase [Clostridia bacterium]|nr:pyrroline-5-carboxylate reductase [Clostridia bacterium]